MMNLAEAAQFGAWRAAGGDPEAVLRRARDTSMSRMIEQISALFAHVRAQVDAVHEGIEEHGAAIAAEREALLGQIRIVLRELLQYAEETEEQREPGEAYIRAKELEIPIRALRLSEQEKVLANLRDLLKAYKAQPSKAEEFMSFASHGATWVIQGEIQARREAERIEDERIRQEVQRRLAAMGGGR